VPNAEFVRISGYGFGFFSRVSQHVAEFFSICQRQAER
jgi:hypothetical protein